MVLKGDKRQGKTRVAAVPEHERDVERCFRQGIARCANVAGCVAIAGTINVRKAGVREVGKVSGLADHLVVATLLFRGQGELVPDMHPITVLAINALPTNFYLNLGNHLLARDNQASER